MWCRKGRTRLNLLRFLVNVFFRNAEAGVSVDETGEEGSVWRYDFGL
jgi:hypothetical protein